LKEHKGIFGIPVINSHLKQLGVPVVWTIIGNGPEKNKFMELVKQEDNFSFYQPENYADVLDLLKQQDIFVLPSFLDGLPVAMLESMSVGCVPVVSNFNSGISAIISAEIGFVLDQKDHAGFANRIKCLHENRSLLASLSMGAQQLVENNYDIKKQAAQYYSLCMQYKTLKKKQRKKYINYGISTHPWVPVYLRNYLLKFSSLLQKARS
jgi:glycosyltransferase involved in cell wall biosynthesis